MCQRESRMTRYTRTIDRLRITGTIAHGQFATCERVEVYIAGEWVELTEECAACKVARAEIYQWFVSNHDAATVAKEGV